MEWDSIFQVKNDIVPPIYKEFSQGERLLVLKDSEASLPQIVPETLAMISRWLHEQKVSSQEFGICLSQNPKLHLHCKNQCKFHKFLGILDVVLSKGESKDIYRF